MQLSLPYELSAGTSDFARKLTQFLKPLALGFRAHLLLFVITGAFLLATFAVTYQYPTNIAFDFMSLAKTFLSAALPSLLLSLVTYRFIYIAIVDRPANPTIALLKDLKSFIFSPPRFINALPVVIALIVFMKCYTDLKNLIPVMNPFSWDKSFMDLDQWLHFGFHPWEILQPLLGYPLITFVINVSYNLWFIIMWMVWVFLAFSKDHSVIRTQFFTAFMLSWSLGGALLATIFSSAGPCYYSLIGLNPDPFAPHMSYLRAVNEVFPIWAVTTQDMLWSVYQGHPGLAGGISAMPSMHNATAAILALVGWKLDKRLGAALTIFACFVLIGSVHLGWHYAVDGYFAIVFAWLIWWISGKIAVWYHGLSVSQTYARYLKKLNRSTWTNSISMNSSKVSASHAVA